jgi:hypothetical protein
MADILEAFESASEPQRLEVVRLGANPALILCFTRDSEPARMHWEDDPTVHAHVPCTDGGCPACFSHEVPVAYHLLPVIEVEKRKVGVLMVSMARGPQSLAAHLLPHLRDSDVDNKLFVISRVQWKFDVTVRPLGERADRCTDIVKAFVAAHSRGLSLLSAFPKLSPADWAEVPRMRARLNTLGGWTPPEP